MKKYKKKDIEQFIEQILALRDGASDEAAAAAPDLFPSLKQDGKPIKAGKRINIKGEIYRSLEDIEDIEKNNPYNAPGKWEKIERKRKEDK